MLRQVEFENKGYDSFIIDFREEQIDLRNILLMAGYKELIVTNLYNSNRRDFVYIKSSNKEKH